MDNRQKAIEIIAALATACGGKAHIGLQTVGEAIAGRLAKLREVSIAAARAEGVSAGEQAQRDRSAEKQP